MNYKPHEYQQYATDFIIKNPTAAVFLDMGLGKSVIALTAILELCLERFEIRLGISCGDYGADGEFGDCTEMAVIAFQKQHALEADGEYGPLTHASLTAELDRLDNPAQQNCVRIVGGNCYVRVESNTEAEKLGVAHRDTLLPYQGETAANGWLKVSFGGRDGWVSGKYGRICG